MHASIWRLSGDPDLLAPRYDALLAELGTAGMAVQLCLRADDGLVIVDTCPSREVFEAFVASAEFHALLRRHGLPKPTIEDHAVHAAVLDGGRVL